jgi:ubiquinone/menaquinone biosynthesis C-methylase UbiE
MRTGDSPHCWPSVVAQRIRARRLGAAALLLLLAGGGSPGQTSDEAEFATVVSLLRIGEGSIVADVGAGGGAWSARLSRKVGTAGRVYASEVNRALCHEIESLAARESLGNVEVVAAQDDDPKLPKGRLDAVLMRFVYHAVRSREATMRGIRRALRPGGRLLVIDYAPPEPQLMDQLRAWRFEPIEVAEPWQFTGKQTYGALFAAPR